MDIIFNTYNYTASYYPNKHEQALLHKMYRDQMLYGIATIDPNEFNLNQIYNFPECCINILEDILP